MRHSFSVAEQEGLCLQKKPETRCASVTDNRFRHEGALNPQWPEL
jgi:hypothetical protein